MNWLREVFATKGDPHLGNPQTSSSDASSKDNYGPVGFTADNPIRTPEEDVLGRGSAARSFAAQVLSLDVSDGVVVGLLGPWGSGKTSFLNLARAYLEEGGNVVLDFNPWMFSGTEQLIQAFFSEISAQLKLHPGLNEVGESLDKYGEIFSGLGWLPLIGTWIQFGAKVTKIAAKLLQSRKEGVSGRRAKVEKALASIERPLTVVLDDIDRLTTAEIRDVFKLVRLTANFPNVIYILAFDRTRVENALGEQGIPGRDYLEKILQIGVDLPTVSTEVLTKQVVQAIDKALSTIKHNGLFDESVWPDIFMEIIRPLVRNMRDVRRYAAAVHGTVRSFEGKIALADLLALEAIRVFLPDVFARLYESIDALTRVSDFGYSHQEGSQRNMAQIHAMLNAANTAPEVVRSLVLRLFPAAERHLGGSHFGSDWKSKWLRERRVAHPELLRFYLERVPGEMLQTFALAEDAWLRMANTDDLNSYLRSLDLEKLRDVIASLETYEEQFRPEHVTPGSVVLLNILPELPDSKRSMFDPGSRTVVKRVVYRLVRSLKDSAAIEISVREILPKLNSLTSKLDLITIVGHRKDEGHKLISENQASTLEKDWRDALRRAAPELLVKETDLLRILLVAKREAKPEEPPIELADLPNLTLAVFRAARTEVQSQVAGSRAMRRSPRLAWEYLVELFGGEETLSERIEHAKTPEQTEDVELLRLVDRYQGGWRPGYFEEE